MRSNVMSKHWTSDDLINRLYEVSTGEEAHLAECADCRLRWEQLLARRQGVVAEPVLAEPSVPPELLAAQRRAIYGRIEAGGRSGFWHLRLAPALAALSMVILGIVLSRPAPTPKAETVAVNDESEQFFTEVYSMLSSEPAAVAPIRGLFEE